MKAYKLTDHNGKTRNGTQWGEGIEHTSTSTSETLCSDGWIHFYTDPLLAVLMNSAHARFESPLLWECETSGEHLHEPLKSGCKTLKTIRTIPMPEITDRQRIAFGILCVKQCYKDPYWNKWADNWLSGVNRFSESASLADWSYRTMNRSLPANAAYIAGYLAIHVAYAATKSDDFTMSNGNKSSNYIASSVANVAAYIDINCDATIDFVSIAKQALTYK